MTTLAPPVPVKPPAPEFPLDDEVSDAALAALLHVADLLAGEPFPAGFPAANPNKDAPR